MVNPSEGVAQQNSVSQHISLLIHYVYHDNQKQLKTQSIVFPSAMWNQGLAALWDSGPPLLVTPQGELLYVCPSHEY